MRRDDLDVGRACHDRAGQRALGLLICGAWLGPNEQVTWQTNVVNPGGQAQTVHRDYHLGSMDREQALASPAPVHLLSPALTLQGRPPEKVPWPTCAPVPSTSGRC